MPDAAAGFRLEETLAFKNKSMQKTGAQRPGFLSVPGMDACRGREKGQSSSFRCIMAR